jgi:hypothetical protein
LSENPFSVGTPLILRPAIRVVGACMSAAICSVLIIGDPALANIAEKIIVPAVIWCLVALLSGGFHDRSGWCNLVHAGRIHMHNGVYGWPLPLDSLAA